ncbi:gp34 [Brochothrix phage BL3]|uniref:anti-repressor n=1 Tax=Brochothrix phage BL3 TaxID=764562 RepID=UPI0001D9ADCB|nr:anti-repressor [Brochothrix phage BL3]ADH03115.1 gp34 [Brochothrix phage BL3]
MQTLATKNIIEQSGQRVLTTSQLAESYGAEEKLVQQNFNNNKHRYLEGKHFILLQNDELRGFKRNFENLGFAKNINKLYLWTEKGAWLHAKSLNTDAAWDAYELLVDEYYRLAEEVKQSDTSNLSPELQMFNGIFQSLVKQEQATKQLESKVDNISDIVGVNYTNWREECNKLINKVVNVRGGFDEHKNVRSEIHKEVDKRAGVSLSIRLTNKRRRMADNGVSVSQRNKLSKTDVIAEDKKLIEIYTVVVKELAIKYKVF